MDVPPNDTNGNITSGLDRIEQYQFDGNYLENEDVPQSDTNGNIISGLEQIQQYQLEDVPQSDTNGNIISGLEQIEHNQLHGIYSENETVQQMMVYDNDEVVLQISADDSNIVVSTNYTVLGCYIEDDSLNLVNLFETQDEAEQTIETYTNNVPFPARTQSINEQSATESCDDPEMNILMAELRIKYCGQLQDTESFRSNPLLSENTQYIVFPRDEEQENRIGNRNWCTCNNCPEMKTNIECICCHEVDNAQEFITDSNCIIGHEFFHIFCQREDTVNVVLRTIGQVRLPPAQKDMNRQRSKTAYRTFTAWVHGYLGVGNRRPIPACVVYKV
ncbi:uncharacterized protein LOC122944008 [Bufo gargarizans]|uniref:uncharacterized protein LOC122944008 n=1 Tax=Bufo gargarizans TaxID=30331 RepID=UPI001CF2CA73|nr:uncharacterized protein LOC122944008 [Bufo gargarizans]